MVPTDFERALHAAKSNDAGALERIFRDTPGVLRARDAEGHTLLGLACKSTVNKLASPVASAAPERYAAVDLILAAGVDPSATADDGSAPLHTAAAAGHVDLMRRLLDAGANPDGHLLGTRGGSPLALGLFYGRAQSMDLLASPPLPDNLRGAAALERSIERFVHGDALTAQAAEGTDFYRPTLGFPSWERTNSRQELLDEALSWAARNDACKSMGELVRLGANVNANAYRGTALLWAIFADRVAAASWLLDHGADPDLRHDFGGTDHGAGAVAMHLAAQFNCLECLRLLLDRGADPTIEDAAYKATPLGWADHHGSVEAAAMLRGIRN